MNCHEGCEHYVPENDMCLLYFEFGYHEVSQYSECVGKEIFGEDL